MDKAFKVAVTLTAYDKLSSIVNGAVGKSTGQLNKFSHNAKEFAERALLIGEAGKEFFEGSIESAEAHEVAAKRMETVFENMHAAESKAAIGARSFASEYAKQIGKNSEVVMDTQSKLAIFTNVINKTGDMSNAFERATKAAFDLGANGIGDATSNAIKLGKILQDPIKNINVLSRAGIQFNDKEKAKLKVLVASGQLFKAQNIILSKVEGKVGSLAAKTATATDKMKVGWHEATISIGNALLPTFNNLVNKVTTKLIPAFQKFTDEHPQLVKWLAIGAASLLAVGVAGSVISFTMSGVSNVISLVSTSFKFLGNAVATVSRVMMANPILLIIAAIAVAAYLIIMNWSKIKAFFSNLWNWISDKTSKAWEFIKAVVMAPVNWIIAKWRVISDFFSGIWQGVKDAAKAAGQWVYDKVTAPIKWIKEKWQGVKDWFSNLWSKAKTTVKATIEIAKNPFQSPVKTFIKQVQKDNPALVNAMAKSMQTVDDHLPHSPAKRGPLKNLNKVRIIETIIKAIQPNPVSRAMTRVTNAVANASGKSQSINNRNNQASIHLTYAPVFNGGAGDDIMDQLKKHSKDMMQMLNEEMRKADRRKF